MNARLHALLFAVSLAAAAGVSLGVPAEGRKALRVEGEGGALVTAVTTVFLDDRFTGFTLADAQGASRPFSLLGRTGSRCAIHFDAKAGESLTLLPSAHAALPPPGGDHLSGLRHLVKGYDGREVTSAAQFAELWKSAALQGGEFAEQVYAAFNPFGPNAGALHQYDGTLLAEKEGDYQFCLASTDAAFLFVDGREVVAWPGKHPVQEGLAGKIRGSARLAAGPHCFAFLHANSGSTSFAIAAWVPPGETRHCVIGPERFTRAAYAFVGPLVGEGGARPADFLWEDRHMVNIGERCLHQLAFEAAAQKDAPGATYAWDFGDGTRGTGAKAEHLYFALGDVTVTLTATAADGSSTRCRQTVRVAPRYGQNENDDARALALLDQAVRQEQACGLQPEGYGLISSGYFFFLQEQKADAFAERFLAAAGRVPQADLSGPLTQLALGVQQVDEHYELAARCFRAVLEHLKEPAARAFAALHYGGMLNLCLNRPEEARELLNAVDAKALGEADRRLLEIYLADTALVLDNVAAARKRYTAIPPPAALITAGRVDRAAAFDYNTRFFRLQNLLEQGLYRESLEALDLLEWELPSERLSPRMNLLKVQALAGNNQPKKAVVCLQRALLAEVDDACRPALRLELAKLHTGLRQYAQAKSQIALIRKESPQSQEEIDARKLLAEIDRRIEEEQP